MYVCMYVCMLRIFIHIIICIITDILQAYITNIYVVTHIQSYTCIYIYIHIIRTSIVYSILSNEYKCINGLKPQQLPIKDLSSARYPSWSRSNS